MVSDIQRVSVFGYCPYSVTFPYSYNNIMYEENNQNVLNLSVSSQNISNE